MRLFFLQSFGKSKTCCLKGIIIIKYKKQIVYDFQFYESNRLPYTLLTSKQLASFLKHSTVAFLEIKKRSEYEMKNWHNFISSYLIWTILDYSKVPNGFYNASHTFLIWRLILKTLHQLNFYKSEKEVKMNENPPINSYTHVWFGWFLYHIKALDEL